MVTMDDLIETYHCLADINKGKIKDYYKVYKIRQGRRGKTRLIEEPIEPLKRLQKDMIPHFEKVRLHAACMSRKDKSIVHNAALHAEAHHVLKIDLQNCYQTISRHMVSKAISIYGELLDFIPFCFLDNHLPTGAPTSPILCNIALTSLDIELSNLAYDFGYLYTRYIDDLHFSTKSKQRDSSIVDSIKTVIKGFGLTPHPRKTQWMTVGHKDHVKVTGVMIGRNTKVPVQFKRMLRSKLQNLAKEGKDIDAEARGCLAYVKSIDPDKHDDLLAYYERRLEYSLTS